MTKQRIISAQVKPCLAEIDVADLPPLARDLVALIGFGAAVALIEARAGLPTYIPNVASETHYLAGIVGFPAFTLLIKKYQGYMLVIPNCKYAVTKTRHRAILRLRDDGFSQTAISALTGLTPRQIRNIEYSIPAEERNGSLF